MEGAYSRSNVFWQDFGGQLADWFDNTKALSLLSKVNGPPVDSNWLLAS